MRAARLPRLEAYGSLTLPHWSITAMSEHLFVNETAVVTGAASNIGRGLAMALAGGLQLFSWIDAPATSD